mgnify:CR=1 FL=1
MSGRVIGIHISEQKGTIKRPVLTVEITPLGLAGDAHAGRWHRQVSLLDAEAVEQFTAKTGTPVAPGEFAENILLEGVPLSQAAPLDRLTVGSVELEITQIGKECHGPGCSVSQRVGTCLMPQEGIFARVVKPGFVRVGDSAILTERPLTIHVVTLSDRAAAGEYEDQSGPRIVELVRRHFAGTRWHLTIERTVLPDEPEMFHKLLIADKNALVDVVITTGGTGLGPRDITPDVIRNLADCEIPGIMEHVRLTYGARNPAALLSRSTAAIIGNTLVFALPGNVRAVEEYCTEILTVLEHAILMRHGLGH